MKKEDLKNKTTEKLESELKQLQAFTWIFTGVLITLFAVVIYGLFTNKSSTDLPLLAVAISCSAVLITQFSNIKKLKIELETRRQDT
jgi:hypothetical protein